MRVVLIGTVESTSIALDAFVLVGYPPVALVTLPPQRSKRHSDYVDLRPQAIAASIPVIEAVNVNDSSILGELERLNPDFIFVIGWSQLLGSRLLELPRNGCIGYHPSLLPDGRGRGVIPWTILRRLSETGSTFFWLDEGMDSGDILSQERFSVSLDETARRLYDKHIASIKRQLQSVLPRMAGGEFPRYPQDHTVATYCARRTSEDGHIDWHKSAVDVSTLIRGSGDPYPGAFSYYRGEILRIFDADLIGIQPYIGIPGQVQWVDDNGVVVQCGDGQHVLLKTVQHGENPVTSASSILRVHEKLGVNLVSLFESLKGRGLL